jgi:hypothetical protein
MGSAMAIRPATDQLSHPQGQDGWRRVPRGCRGRLRWSGLPVIAWGLMPMGMPHGRGQHDYVTAARRPHAPPRRPTRIQRGSRPDRAIPGRRAPKAPYFQPAQTAHYSPGAHICSFADSTVRKTWAATHTPALGSGATTPGSALLTERGGWAPSTGRIDDRHSDRDRESECDHSKQRVLQRAEPAPGGVRRSGVSAS